MNLPKTIGGYFELEVSSRSNSFLHDDAILLNTARNCFEYILKANNARHVYMPRFTCDVMLEPLNKLDIPYTFYSINKNLEIISNPELDKGEYLLYTNYFGIKDQYSHEMSELYGNNLILDCSQAYYFEPLKTGHTIYSPRKFFGLPDGGCLYTSKTLSGELPIDSSADRMSHLLKRLDQGAEAGYADFKLNDAKLIGQPIMQMSNLTRRLLASIDFTRAQKIRKENFRFLHESLNDINGYRHEYDDSTPMIYPLLVDQVDLRQKLIDEKIFVAKYWPNVLEWSHEEDLEYTLANQLLPLPIDQRYDINDMKKIADVIKSNI